MSVTILYVQSFMAAIDRL